MNGRRHGAVRCRGAALGIVLVLLGVLAGLALASTAAALTALALASHQQAALLAFEAAEAGLRAALEQAAIDPAPAQTAELPFPDSAAPLAFVATVTQAIEGAGLPEGFSIGENAGSWSARHFVIIADGRGDRGARIRLEQGFYVVEPRS